MFVDEKDGVGAGYLLVYGAMFSNALREAAEIIGHAAQPQCTGGPRGEVSVVVGQPSGGVSYRLGFG